MAIVLEMTELWSKCLFVANGNDTLFEKESNNTTFTEEITLSLL